jgi:hypothetical protein
MISLLITANKSFNVDAFIRREYTLEEVVHACSNVMFGKVASIDQKKMCFVVDEIENVKGKNQFKEVKVSFAIGQGDSIQKLIDRLHDDVPVVIFYIPQGTRRLEALGYISDIWIRLFAIDNTRDFEWHFTHIEKYMNRTFDADCLELQSSVRDILGIKESSDTKNENVINSLLKRFVCFFAKLW